MPKHTLEFKQILLTIARLPIADQRWILQNLSQNQLTLFRQNKGLTLLKKARSFRILKTMPSIPQAKQLPEYTEALAAKAPLYIAIVLKNSSYPWETLFLQLNDIHGSIQNALQNQVKEIKPAVKEALLHEWESQLG